MFLDDFLKTDLDKTALVYFKKSDFDFLGEFTSMTYREFDLEIEKRAAYLQSCHILPGSYIGVCFSSGENYALWMMAIWRAGLVYLPFSWRKDDKQDDNLERISRNLKLCESTHLIIERDYAERFKNMDVKIHLHDAALKSDHKISNAESPKDIKFAICSSGTTGTPKMITVPLEAILDRIISHVEYMKMNANDNMLSLLEYEFDASIVEMLLAFVSGGTLIVGPQNVRNGYLPLPEFFQFCQKKRLSISTAIFLPTLLQQILLLKYQKKDFPGLKRFIVTGEACNMAQLKAWLSGVDPVEVYDGYGPSETTFGVSLTKVELEKPISIHLPMSGMTLMALQKNKQDKKYYLCDKNSTLRDVELWIAGKGIAAYLKNEDLTKKHFHKAGECLNKDALAFYKLKQEDKVYRTFDIAEQQGQYLIYRYRKDGILKRGAKQIALPEIEKEIQEELSKLVKQTIVTPIQRDMGTYAIFLQPHNDVTDSEIKNAVTQFIENQLTFYKRPTLIYLLKQDAHLKTNNGKTLRNYGILKEMSLLLHENSIKIELSDIENKIVNIWKSILQIDHVPISRECDFINHLGASSLQVATMFTIFWRELINPHVERPINIFALFEKGIKLEKMAGLVACYKRISLKINTSGKPIVFFFSDHTTFKPKHLDFLKIEGVLQEDSSLAAYVILQKIQEANLNEIFEFVYQGDVEKQICEKIADFNHKIKLTIYLPFEEDFESLEKKLVEAADKSQINELKLNVKRLNKKYLNSTDTLITLTPAQNEFYYEKIIQGFISKDVLENRILCLTGEAGSGKTTICQQLLTLENYYIFYMPLYEYKQQGDIHKWLTANGIKNSEINILKTKPVIFILEDYERIGRYDFPNIWKIENFKSWSNIKLIMTCRDWYLRDSASTKSIGAVLPIPNDVSNMDVIYKEKSEIVQLTKAKIGKVNPLTLKIMSQMHDFKDWQDIDFKNQFVKIYLKREYQQDGIQYNPSKKDVYEFVQNLEKFAAESPISLIFKPLSWELNQPEINQKISRYDLNFNYFSIFFESISPWTKVLKSKQLSTQLVREMNDENVKIDKRRNYLSNHKSIEILQRGLVIKPIIAFAPLDGATPKCYREIAAKLGVQQPFYSCVLSGSDNEIDLNKRIEHYIEIITEYFPNPKDSRQEMILIGYSFGFIQAYKAACILSERGYKIAKLINIDCPSPEDIEKSQTSPLALRYILKMLIDLYNQRYLKSGTIALAKDKISELKDATISDYFDIVKTSIKERDEQNNFFPILENARLNWNIYIKSKQIFDIKKMPFSITTFKATKQHESLKEAKFNWDIYCNKNEIIEVAGDHFSLFYNSNFDEICIKNILEVQLPCFTLSFEERIRNFLDEQNIKFSSLENSIDLLVKTDDEISHFSEFWHKCLDENYVKTFVLTGEPGSGKSTLMKLLAKSVQSKSWIPIIIPLGQQRNFDIYNFLSEIKLSALEMQQRNLNILFLFDGFDEMAIPVNLQQKLNEIKFNFKVIITCRDYYYKQVNTQNYFGSHRVASLQPLSEDQKNKYLENACSEEDKKWLSKSSQFDEFFKNPLLLKLTVIIIKELRILPKIDRTIIYETYVDHMLKMDETRVKESLGVHPMVRLNVAFKHYLQALAIHLWLQRQNLVSIYSEPKDLFIRDDYETSLVRRQSFVNQRGNELQFEHETFSEYFVASAIFQELLKFKKDISDNTLVLFKKATLKSNNSLLKFILGKILNLSGKAQVKITHTLVMLSALTRSQDCHADLSVAAGNALTIINYLKVSFSHFDFSNMKLIGADFSNGILEYADFSFSELKQCDFQNALVLKNSFNQTNILETNFGELPDISIEGKVEFAQYVYHYKIWIVIQKSNNERLDNIYIKLINIQNNKLLIQHEIGVELKSMNQKFHYEDARSLLYILTNTESSSLIYIYCIEPSSISLVVKFDLQTIYFDMKITNQYLLFLNDDEFKIIQLKNMQVLDHYSIKLKAKVLGWNFCESRHEIAAVIMHQEPPIQMINILNKESKGINSDSFKLWDEEKSQKPKLLFSDDLNVLIESYELGYNGRVIGYELKETAELIFAEHIGHIDISFLPNSHFFICYDYEYNKTLCKVFNLHDIKARQEQIFIDKFSCIRCNYENQYIETSQYILSESDFEKPYIDVIEERLWFTTLSIKKMRKAQIDESYYISNENRLEPRYQTMSEIIASENSQKIENNASIKIGFAVINFRKNKTIYFENVNELECVTVRSEMIIEVRDINTNNLIIQIDFKNAYHFKYVESNVHYMKGLRMLCVEKNELLAQGVDWEFKDVTTKMPVTPEDKRRLLEAFEKMSERTFFKSPPYPICIHYQELLFIKNANEIFIYNTKLQFLHKCEFEGLIDYEIIHNAKYLITILTDKFVIFHLQRINDTLKIEKKFTLAFPFLKHFIQASNRAIKSHWNHGIESLILTFYDDFKSFVGGAAWRICELNNELLISLIHIEPYKFILQDLNISGLKAEPEIIRLLEAHAQASDEIKPKNLNVDTKIIDFNLSLTVEKLPVQVWFIIIASLSYSDRIRLSQTSRALYQTCHAPELNSLFGKILTTEFINQIKPALLKFYQQFACNALIKIPSDITLKPSKKYPGLVKVGFFGLQKSFKLPIKVMETFTESNNHGAKM